MRQQELREFRLISPEPEFLNIIDALWTEYTKLPRITMVEPLPREAIIRLVLDYAKDVAKWCRRRENIISTLGFVISTEVWEEIMNRFRGNE